MKVSGSGAAGPASGAGRAKGASSGEGFRLPNVAGAAPAAAAGPAGPVASVSGLSALLALQETGGPLERRRRAVSRAGRILDVLDEVKLALVSGELSLSQLERLTRHPDHQPLSPSDQQQWPGPRQSC